MSPMRGEEAGEAIVIEGEFAFVCRKHGGQTIAEDVAIGETDEGTNTSRVDGLSRGDGQTFTSKHPEKLIENP